MFSQPLLCPHHPVPHPRGSSATSHNASPLCEVPSWGRRSEPVMALIGTALARCLDDERIGIIDSTTLEASQYSKYVGYHFLKHTSPIWAGTRYGWCILRKLMPTSCAFRHSSRSLNPYNRTMAGCCLIPRIISRHMLSGPVSPACQATIVLRAGTVVQEEDTVNRIRYWANKHWKAGGGVHAPLEEQLTFFSLPAGKSETGLSGCSFGTKKSANP